MNGKSCDCRGFDRVVQFAVSLTLLAAGCSGNPSPPSDEGRPVKVMVVSAAGAPHVRSFPGKVEASKKVELAFQVPGIIVALPVKEGDTVKKGALIAQLRQKDFETDLKEAQSRLNEARASLRALQSGERPEQQLRLEAQLRAAEATLANARSEFERQERLARVNAAARADLERSARDYRVAQQDQQAARQMLEKGTIAREEDIEAQEAVVHRLEAQVVQANLRLEDSTLRAPYDGVIAKLFVNQSQTMKAKEPVARFQDVEEIDVIVDVPERIMATDIRTADIVQLLAEFSGAPGRQFPVRISEVAQVADPVTQTFPVRVSMQSPSDVRLLPGMTATVTVSYHRADILSDRFLVPISAIFKDASGEQIAWVVGSEQTVTRRPVKLGEATGDRIEIIDGLQPGDRIAVAGVTHLRDGMKVRDLGDALGGDRP
jgi:RND family efflux transporter MFP subunit